MDPLEGTFLRLVGWMDEVLGRRVVAERVKLEGVVRLWWLVGAETQMEALFGVSGTGMAGPRLAIAEIQTPVPLVVGEGPLLLMRVARTEMAVALRPQVKECPLMLESEKEDKKMASPLQAPQMASVAGQAFLYRTLSSP